MHALRALAAKLIATVFGIGYCPVAPGTAGTLAGFALFYLLRPEPFVHCALILGILLVGTIAAQHAEKAFGRKDSSRIVIDEVAGYAVAILFLPMTAGYLIAGFFLFRFFDIVKPPPVRQIERVLPGGIGVMMDDVAAGIYTNIVLQLWKSFS
ncbi:MAG: phosphatidylglycerophosphatase A [Nitrospirae bacterium]|nr:MAG: phosphatidylglycerophosphatase A [Nitrospirota bacterium]